MKIRKRSRSASSGRFVPASEVYANPAGTVTETTRPASEAKCPHCGTTLELREVKP